MKIPFLNTSIEKDFYFLIKLIPFWWLTGINFIVFHLFSLIALFKLAMLNIKTNKIIKTPYVCFLLIFFILIYILAIILNIYESSFSRILAAFYNLSFWIIGLIVIILIYNKFETTFILMFLRSIYWLTIFLIFLALIAFFLYFKGFQQEINFKSILLMLFPNLENIFKIAPLISSSLNPTILYVDYFFNISLPRLRGIENYSTAFGGLMMLLIPMNIAYLKIKGTGKFKIFIITLLIVLLMIFSLSRIAFLSLFTGWLYVNILKKKKFFILTTLTIFIIILPSFNIIDKIFLMKRGSTETRLSLYNMAINEVLNKQPIIGLGIKPRREDLDIPIGSHSTYIGVIYKTGILGFIFFILFFISVNLQYIKLRRYIYIDKNFKFFLDMLGICLIAGQIWMFTDDLDAAPIFSFLYFMIIGLIIFLKDKFEKNEIKRITSFYIISKNHNIL
ncbi:MAG: hypothetical protein QXX45_03450 [Candidatus Aenigmatarchaeota archaeon]